MKLTIIFAVIIYVCYGSKIIFVNMTNTLEQVKNNVTRNTMMEIQDNFTYNFTYDFTHDKKYRNNIVHNDNYKNIIDYNIYYKGNTLSKILHDKNQLPNNYYENICKINYCNNFIYDSYKYNI